MTDTLLSLQLPKNAQLQNGINMVIRHRTRDGIEGFHRGVQVELTMTGRLMPLTVTLDPAPTHILFHQLSWRHKAYLDFLVNPDLRDYEKLLNAFSGHYKIPIEQVPSEPLLLVMWKMEGCSES